MITAELTPDSLPRVNATLEKVSRGSKKVMERNLRRVFRWACESAAKATPAAKNRKMRQVGRLTRAQRHDRTPPIPWWAAYEIDNDAPGEPPFYAVDRASAIRARKPKYRGLAKAAWWRGYALAMRGPIGGGVTSAVADASSRLAAGRYDLSASATIVYAEATNKVPYIDAIAAGVANAATESAGKRLLALWTREVNGELKKAYI